MSGILLTSLLERDSILAWLPCANLVFSRLRMLFCYRYTTVIDKMAKSVWPVWHCLLCRWLSKVSEAPLKPAMTRYNTFTPHSCNFINIWWGQNVSISKFEKFRRILCFPYGMFLSQGSASLVLLKFWWDLKSEMERRQNYIAFYIFLRHIRKELICLESLLWF